MKSLASIVALLLALTANAGETIVSQKVVNLPVELNKAKVKYTNLGYGQTYFVKIIVPELAAETVLNHRNEGEDGPCLRTSPEFGVDDFLQDKEETVVAPFEVTLIKEFNLDPTNPAICKVTIGEVLRTKIRGFDFIHVKKEALPDRHADDCK